METTKYGACAKHPNSSMEDKSLSDFFIDLESAGEAYKTTKHPDPDFDKMWLNIVDKIDNPLVYLLEHKETKEWVHRKENRTTKEPLCAMKFEGKDGKAMANLFLYLNQEAGALKDFIVTEHLFVDNNDYNLNP